METNTISSVFPLAMFVFLYLGQETAADLSANCQTKCNGLLAYYTQFSYHQSFLNNAYSTCLSTCLKPNEGKDSRILYGPQQKNTNRPLIPTHRPTNPPVVWTPRPTKPPVIWTPRPTNPPVIWTHRPTNPPIIWTQRPTKPPVIWTPRPTNPPVIWTQRPTKTPVIWTPRPTNPPAIWTQRPTKPPVIWTPKPTPSTGPVRPTQQGCGFRRTFGSRIIGGRSAEPCEFPWMVVVRVPRDFCGGAIIDKRHVLTAAHCVINYYNKRVVHAKNIQVKLGSSRQTELRTVGAVAVHVHPKHNVYKDYDVAVITLKQDLSFGSCVAPICLPTEEQKAERMDECVVAGWGIMNPGLVHNRQPNVLQKVKVPIVSDADCLRAYHDRYYNDLKICAGNYQQGGKDSCKGDSGGPLMCRNKMGPYIVFGIVSFGNSCALPRYPGVYTRVNHPSIIRYIIESTRD